jgi:hypothetical protein
MPKAVDQRGGVSKSPLPENRLVTNPKRNNKMERGGVGVSRGTISKNSPDGGPSKQKRFK